MFPRRFPDNYSDEEGFFFIFFFSSATRFQTDVYLCTTIYMI